MSKRIFTVVAACLCSAVMFAQSFEALWKQYKDAVEKDLPKTQEEVLKKISAKAEKDPVFNEVWKAVMAKYEGKDYVIENPELLAGGKSSAYVPFVEKGPDSELFNGDLLHAVGMYVGDYDTMIRYYKEHGNRRVLPLLYAEKNTSRTDEEWDQLFKEYGDLVECGELAIARHDDMVRHRASAKKRIEWIDASLNRWGKWKRINVLRNERLMLTQPGYNVRMNQHMVMPGKETKVEVFDVRNLESLTMKVRNKSNKTIVQTETIRFVGKKDYELSSDTITIRPLPLGEYEVMFDNDQTLELNVTDLFVLCEYLPANNIRYAVVSATTGQPVAGAHLRLSFKNEKANSVVTLTTDSRGETIYNYKEGIPSKVYAYTDSDKSFVGQSMWGNYIFYDSRSSQNIVNIYTDRKIYRPSQTVHVSLLAYNNKHGQTVTIINGKTIKLSLRNANNEVVAEKNVTTDEYGSAACDFILPQSGVSGTYSISGDFGGYAYINVEQYKRPTFEVTFDEVKEKYVAGDTVTIKGHARSYGGVPVTNAKVSYNVSRKRSFWWWRRNDRKVTIDSGETYTDADGNFTLRMPLVMPEKKEGERESLFYSFTAEADVTDQSGESHNAQQTLGVGTKPAILSVDLPKQVLRDSLNQMTFTLYNAAGQEIEGDVTYTIDGKQMPTAKAGEAIKQLSALTISGRHTVEAIALGDTLRHEVVVFTLKDKKPVIETHDWFYASATEFSDKQPVTVQAGSSDPDTHIFYTFFANEKVVESGAIDVSNALYTRTFNYKEEYGDGLLLTYAWVKDGKCYTHTAKINKPLPDKRLRMEWKTFRNRLEAGQKEEWTLNIKRPDGKPAKAQLLSTLYDHSLDQLTSYDWNLNLGYFQNLPTTNWRSTILGSQGKSYYKDIRLKDVSDLSFDQLYPVVKPYSFYIDRHPLMRVRGTQMMGTPKAANTMMMKSVAVEESSDKVFYSLKEASPAADVAGEEPTKGNTSSSVRENFSETAFFYPSLMTDDKGDVSVRFTLPESITTWRFMGLAHDLEMNYGIIDATAVAKKDLMTQPNMPRFVRKGDNATIAAKITNTAEGAISGTATMTILDAETENVIYTEQQKFAVEKDKTTAVSFGYTPDGKHSLLICRIVAVAGNFSDGEQHYLPVLSDEELVINTEAFNMNAPTTKTIALAAGGSSTIEYTQNPAWLVVQAMPYLAQTNEKNAISLASSYYVNSIGRHLVRQIPDIEKTFRLWQQEQSTETTLMSQLEKNQELKTLVLEETPWVAEGKKESEQRRAVANFFDSNTLDNRLATALHDLEELQNIDGSFSWWKGMDGSPMMTAQVAEFLTRLNILTGEKSETSEILDKAHKFLSNYTVKEVEKIRSLERAKKPYHISSYFALQWTYLCAISDRKMTAREKSATDYLIKYLEKQKLSQSLYAKALTAIVLYKNGQTRKAAEYVKSLKEYTTYSDEMGRYYDTPRAGYSWRSYTIPTQVAAIEALKMIVPEDHQTVEEMQRWLLQQKRTQTWDTPINSINAIYAFLDGNTSALATQQRDVITVDGELLDIKASAGLGYVKTRVEGGNELKIEKTSTGTSWGAVYTQSVQPLKDIAESSTGLKISREVMTKGELKVGDRVKVRLYIEADRNYDYVQVVDKRAACLEPVNQLSGYQDGCYVTPKDQSTNYYFYMLPQGKHTIESEYYIDREGEYQTGTCTIQCAYAPEFYGRAKSEGVIVKK